ncbi:hypothetical protein, conserved [Plasmodium gonderi]|uniref:Uncharacterized protein n=1 Tax=Plasmodium gonderi TaxID=77519 RepID=A0A1Y1JHW6_PLAGO|nr:hypothetical protein, conserved [Plasmodium gonderi]GAW81248.1 hypothetical protein, conserved [Plasmodium gonderi]
MTEATSYRFKKKPPDLKSNFEMKKEEWCEFIKYMGDLRNMYKCPLQMSGHSSEIHNEDHSVAANKKAICENINDIMKIKEWNHDIEFENHSICKECSSDTVSCSEESDTVYNFNKYKIIQNNIYSNNANSKRQKINDNFINKCIPKEKHEVNEEEKIFRDGICNIRRIRKKITKSPNEEGEFNEQNIKSIKTDLIGSNEQLDIDNKNAIRRPLTKLSKKLFHQKYKNLPYMQYIDENNHTYHGKQYDDSCYVKNANGLICNNFTDVNETYKYNKTRVCAYTGKNNHVKDKTRTWLNSKNYSNLSVHYNVNESDEEKDKKNNPLVKKCNKYEIYSNAINTIHKNSSNKNVNNNSKNNVKIGKSIENNAHFDGLYAYNYAYFDKNDKSADSTPVDNVNGTIMNLEEEIKNYNLHNYT